jgi:hypothetical protein
MLEDDVESEEVVWSHVRRVAAGEPWITLTTLEGGEAAVERRYFEDDERIVLEIAGPEAAVSMFTVFRRSELLRRIGQVCLDEPMRRRESAAEPRILGLDKFLELPDVLRPFADEEKFKLQVLEQASDPPEPQSALVVASNPAVGELLCGIAVEPEVVLLPTTALQLWITLAGLLRDAIGNQEHAEAADALA